MNHSARSPLAVLEEVFGYTSFRGQQAEIVEHISIGEDAIVLMPTGGGKSLCYQIPALCRPGVGVIVSPLISLMRDQVESLKQAGVRAAYWNSSLSLDEAREVESALLRGELELLYVSPERVVQAHFLDTLSRVQLSVIAIDEAHCVSQWGHDFRPEYRQLAQLRERFPGVPRMALTATADKQTRVDMAEVLELRDAKVFLSSFDRPNIRYTVKPRVSGRSELLRFLEGQRGEAGIVYCSTRKKVDETAEFLKKNGIQALPYHGGMTAEERDQNQDRFLYEEGLVVVATLAFGMGIDKPNVRFVAHLDMPKSIEGYYQETGRAGRDGLPAEAWMLYGFSDVVLQRQFIERSESDETQKRVERAKLQALLGYCESATCRRIVLLRYLGEEMREPCNNCDICLHPVELYDATVAQKALSAVYRTGQQFGVEYLTNVLRGRPLETITSRGHDQIKTFGVGADLSENAWKSAFRQLLAAGYVDVDTQGYGAIKLTESARDVLLGTTQVPLRRDVETAKVRRKLGRGDRIEKAREAHPAHGSDRFERLRRVRMQLASEDGVPPYVIFHDRTLLEMCEVMPTTLDELRQISGVGARKAERYGEAFLAALQEGA